MTIGALESCTECGRPSRVLCATDDPRGPRYCPACMRGDREAPPAPSLGTWRPPPGADEPASRAEVGSFGRPTESLPREKPTPETRRELWAELSKAVPR